MTTPLIPAWLPKAVLLLVVVAVLATIWWEWRKK